MKKNILLLILTMCSLAPTHAQQWCPPGAEWRYDGDVCPLECPGYIRMQNAGDTTINGEPCSRIERIRFYQVMDSPVYTDSLTDLYTYSDSGIAWMFDPQLNAFDTLYDFNASPGDSWQLIHLPEPALSDPPFSLTVLDTGHTIMGGNSFRWLSVQYDFGDLWSDQIFLDTLIERIGSIDWYMLPYSLPNGATDAGEGGPLRCYNDNEISYQSPTVQTCDIPLEVTAHVARPKILMYPNPGTDRLTIRMSVGEKLQGVLVHDAFGRIFLHEATPVENEVVLDTERFPSGCYSIEIRSTHGQFVRQWIKE